MDLKEILKQLEIYNIWENPEDEYMRHILEDINDWLEDESDIQDWIEEHLRGNNE